MSFVEDRYTVTLESKMGRTVGVEINLDFTAKENAQAPALGHPTLNAEDRLPIQSMK